MAVELHESSPDCETIIDEKIPNKALSSFESIQLHAVHLPYESKPQAMEKLKESGKLTLQSQTSETSSAPSDRHQSSTQHS